MYSVLLVDDEESVLEVFRTSVNWQELGVEKLLTAMDGMSALEYFRQEQRIDLMIADIRMPRMDGLELIRRVKEISPYTRFIVLTAYGEFSYAQMAIQLGVENYLLKPIAKEEMEQTVHNALENLYREQKSSEILLLENTLRRWSQGNIGSEELSDRAAVLGINLYQSAYCAICIAKRGEASSAMFRSVCIEQLKKMNYDVNSFWDEKNRYVVIVGGKKIDTDMLTKQLADAVKSGHLDDRAVLVVGNSVWNADDLHVSYQMASDAIELADLKNTGLVLDVAESRSDFDTDLLAEEIHLLFYMMEKESCEKTYRRLALKLNRDGWSADKGKRLTHACILALVNEFPNVEGLQENVYQNAAPKVWPEDFEMAENDMIRLLSQVKELFDENFSRRSPIVQRTIRYIRNRVLEGESVSLKEFCSGNSMNPSYLGHLFKTETGFFFNDYLNQCRIERAAALLRNPNRRIKDISEAVGFTYASYFVKCFRRIKGVSPAVYREQQLSRGEKRV